jgi:hypothetical protein
MIETKKITTPDSWKDVTLTQYITMQKDLESYKDDDAAQLDILLYHLCGLNVDEIRTLTANSFNRLKDRVFSLLKQTEHKLQPIIKIDGIEYGFEPNLSQIAYGAYVDITKYDTIAIDNNWGNIMSILYRPIIKKSKGNYEIQEYNGYIDKELWEGVSMDIHFGALFFFVHLLRDLLNSTLNSTIRTEEMPHNIKSILAESGRLIQQSSIWLEGTSKK